MRLVDELPVKLLDCEEVEDVVWPTAFEPLGAAIRIDYTTAIHTGGEEFEGYKHWFTSGVDVFVPYVEGAEQTVDEDVPESVVLDEAYAPILLGVVDRLVVAYTTECIGLYTRPELDEEDVDDLGDIDVVYDIGVTFLAWDPEHKQLIVVGLDGEPLFVVSGGFLSLDNEGMIDG